MLRRVSAAAARDAIARVASVQLRVAPLSSKVGAQTCLMMRPTLPPTVAWGVQPARGFALGAATTNVAGLAYLQTRMGFDNKEMARLERKLMFSPGEAQIQSTLEGVQLHLQLSQAELKKVVLRLPSIIGFNFDSNTRPKMVWLQQSLGLDKKQLHALVRKQNTLLGGSLQKTLIPNLAFYKACFAELSDAEFVSKVVENPRQITISHQRLQDRAGLFDAHGICRSLLFGKAEYTNERMDAWIAKHGRVVR